MFLKICPNCGKSAPMGEYKSGTERKLRPRWFETSHVALPRRCPHCCAAVRFTKWSRNWIVTLFALLPVAAVIFGRWSHGWLVLFLYLVLAFFAASALAFELVEEDAKA
jgi:hypothetical protein